MPMFECASYLSLLFNDTDLNTNPLQSFEKSETIYE